ncbi:oxepin-CoA hydrolase, alternative type [Diaphorobacter aerolatus]|uniref:Enoyl-CoA hydratase/isomerase family protein n=1 Tax=Diaphorobacter aerolatus TaxID=1288495 RepID=A0A7H0GL93_9BURK|nr:enoyl-CoA hydratase [Diaphorobacter aerolatus]QNP49059.1 enoyl-CoA hydratase/isomerase family protein [Diaphorobacter aerolatus]
MPAELQSVSHDHTMVLTINDPQTRNALGPDIYAAGVEALNGAERNRDIRSVIITGANGMFSAGGNLNRLQARRQESAEEQARGVNALHGWIDTIRNFPKPVIAAVEGAAAGAGFSLALACDFIVASREATFIMAYSRVGLSPDGGGTWSLANALPRQLAMEILMGADKVDVQRLHTLGVINRVTQPGQALDDALAFAALLDQRAPNALASIKELVGDARSNSLHAHLDQERDHFVKNLSHTNAGEGITAFFEKRPARYQ